MVPADDPEYIMYVTVHEPKTWDNNFYATVVNPILEEAMSMGDTLDTSVSEGSEKTEETSYQPAILSVRVRARQLTPFVKPDSSDCFGCW